MFGVFLHKQQTIPRIVGAVAVNQLVLSLLLQTAWISQLYGSPYEPLLLTRVGQCSHFGTTPVRDHRNHDQGHGPLLEEGCGMTLPDTIQFIQATSWLGCQPGLERITDLMHLLGDPQKELRYIHITGTNGKGSTAAMLASILQEAGYTVGLFTSPHLCAYNERIRVNGMDISDEELCSAAEIVRPAVDDMDSPPSEFERFTAMALVHFHRSACDIVVLEVGLGGRLDATNVIPAPEVAVLTNIGLEHTEILGDTLEKVAIEKAGIIKPGTDAVTYRCSSEAEKAVQSICRRKGVTLTLARFEDISLHRSDPGWTGIFLADV